VPQLSLDDIEAGAERARTGARLPPVESWNPRLSGDIDIRIARDGTWYHEGGAINRLELVRLFSSLLKREDDQYYLVTPEEKWRIQVEDAPFVIVALERTVEATGTQQLVFSTNVGDQVIAGPDHPLRVVETATRGTAPYLLVRRNLEGLLSRPVYYQLVEIAEPAPDGDGHGVASGGIFHRLG
jgi:hypothetical protein